MQSSLFAEQPTKAAIPAFKVADLDEFYFFASDGGRYLASARRSAYVGAKGPRPDLMRALHVACNAREASFIGRSGLHKAVRRCDVVDALRWASWIAAASSPSKAKAYCRNILLEETRNLYLVNVWQSLRGRSLESMVRDLAASKKKCELRCRYGAFVQYLMAYPIALGSSFETKDGRPEPLSSFQDLYAVLEVESDFGTLLEALWTARLLGRESDMRELLIGRGRRLEVCPAHDLALTKWSQHTFYAPLMFIEMLGGFWSNEANEFHPNRNVELYDELPTMPQLAYYIYDNHTRVGLARYAKRLLEIQPGKPEPPFMDTRFSGLIRGVLWREIAARTHGDGWQNLKWEDVEIPEGLFGLADLMDAFFYRKLIRRAGLEHRYPKLPE